MALKATIFKADLHISDMDRHYYQHHALTLARHPSETNERLMVRLLAFALNAHEHLTFTKGLCVDDEPALWQKDLTGLIEHWIDVGLPDPKLVRKASHQSKKVTVLSYGGHVAELWWAKNRGALTSLENLTIFNLAPETTQTLARLAQRTMRLQCSIEDGHAWLGNEETTVEVFPQRWL